MSPGGARAAAIPTGSAAEKAARATRRRRGVARGRRSLSIGKTITDELAFSLEGANAHYGTPRNPR